MNKPKTAKICGVLCILGAIIVFGWTLLDVGSGITQKMMIAPNYAEGESSNKTIALMLLLLNFSSKKNLTKTHI